VFARYLKNSLRRRRNSEGICQVGQSWNSPFGDWGHIRFCLVVFSWIYFLARYWAYQISALIYAILMAAPPTALSIAGLSSYIAGRSAFWKSHQRIRGPLALLSLAFMFVGGFFFAWTWAFSAYGANKLQPPYAQPLTYYLANNSPYFILSALWLAAGLLVLADAAEAHRKEPSQT
jgi:hypothetical protein